MECYRVSGSRWIVGQCREMGFLVVESFREPADKK